MRGVPIASDRSLESASRRSARRFRGNDPPLDNRFIRSPAFGRVTECAV